MKNLWLKLFGILFCALIFFASCQTDDDKFTGIKISYDSPFAEAESSVKITGTFYNNDKADSTAELSYEIYADTTGGAVLSATTALSGQSVTVTLGSVKGAFVGIKVFAKNYKSTVGIGTNGNAQISLDDIPIGWALYNEEPEGFFSSLGGSTKVKVNNRENFIKYVNQGGCVVYVDGMIDMTDTGSGTMLPDVGSDYNSTPSALDSFVNTKTSGVYTTYSAWKTAYGKACNSATDDKSGKTAQSELYGTMSALNSAYGNIIKVRVGSNTTIIGLNKNSGIRGGSLQVYNASNVVIRNLLLQDACDPFTHHEANDGFNAQFDCIAIQGSQNIWIDHCTLEDTMKLIYVSGEKWQVYDGLCDITNTDFYVTISNCQFKNHDKVMLIGNSSSDVKGSGVTICNNYFYGCGQRLPLTAFSKIHIYNNYYNGTGGFYSNSVCISGRYTEYTIIAENNFFNGVSTAFGSNGSGSNGLCYASGNSTNSGTLGLTSEIPFEVPYAYALRTYSEAKDFVEQYSGAGVLTVISD